MKVSQNQNSTAALEALAQQQAAQKAQQTQAAKPEAQPAQPPPAQQAAHLGKHVDTEG